MNKNDYFLFYDSYVPLKWIFTVQLELSSQKAICSKDVAMYQKFYTTELWKKYLVYTYSNYRYIIEESLTD